MNVPLADGFLSATTRADRSKAVVTPEGTTLEFGIARAGDRLTALVTDGALILAIVLVLALSGFLVGALVGGGFELIGAGFIVAFFVVRVFYFTWFELRRNGSTPGKRWQNLRVVDVGGGQLRSEAVLARNFMREVELWLPLQFLFSAEQQLGMEPGWALLFGSLWILGLAMFPLFNADRRRAGDFVAGTLVVVLPKTSLRGDLGTKRGQIRTQAARPEFAFSREQLEFYGIYELEVLEDVLRKRGKARREAVNAVARKIQKKIGWTTSGQAEDLEAFLRDFYRAQRSHLEHKMLLGKRKERKDVAEGRPPAK